MLWSIVVSILVGAFIGWIASLIMGTDEQQGAVANIVIGIVGSLLGIFIFGSILGFGSAFAAGTLSWAGIFWGLVGSILLILLLQWIGFYRHEKPVEHHR